MGKRCTNCMKVVVIIINVVFLIIGLAILCLSLLAYFNEVTQSIRQLMQNDLVIDIPLFAGMIIGAFTVLISSFGCCGAYHESACLLAAYLVCLLLVTGAQVAGGTFLCIQKAHLKVEAEVINKVSLSLQNMTLENMPKYMVMLQQKLECCGINGTEYDSQTAKAVCVKEGSKEPMKVGCANRISGLVEKNFICVIAGMGCVAGFELLSLSLALAICCCSRSEEEGYVGVNAD